MEEYNQYIVMFELSNGKKYLVCNGYLFIEIKKAMTLQEIQAIAKFYKLKGAKIISSRLWKEFSWQHEKENGGHIIKTQWTSINYMRKHLQYFVNNKYIVNLI